jgi:hypothetical protein
MIYKKLKSKNPLIAVFVVLLFVYTITGAYADDFSDDLPENLLRQPLSWKSSGEALKYHITIFQKDVLSGLYEQCYYHETDRTETDACLIYIEPTLPPGNYRAEIKVCNFFNVVEETLTRTYDFTVYQAYLPEVSDVSYPVSGRSLIYLDDLDNDGIIELEGNNLFMPDSSKRSVSYTDYFLKNGERTIYPDKIISHDEVLNKKITLQFDMDDLLPGSYHFFAQDASGLRSSANSDTEFVIKAGKLVDFDIEAGYTCLFLQDDSLLSYMGETVFPLSAHARLSLFFFKRNWGYFGVGLRANYSYISDVERTYSIDGSIGMAHLALLYQIPLYKRRIFLEVRAGAGGTYFHNIKFHFQKNVESRPLNTVSLSYDAGGSGIFYLTKRFFLEAGFDYTFTVNKNSLVDGMLASFGIGWQF